MDLFTVKEEYEYTIIAVPSGEVFYINGVQLYNLYENDIIEFEPFREFWFFDEKNINKIKLMTK